MKSISLCWTFAAVLAIPACADNITGTFNVASGPTAMGDFSFTGSDFSIEGSGFNCGMPNQISPPSFSFDAMVGGGCGPYGGNPMFGTAIVDGINYGEVHLDGYVDTWVSGNMTQDQFENGGSSSSPGVTNVYLQGCAVSNSGWYVCNSPILFTLQFNVSGMDTTTWHQVGKCCEVAFQTTPEPASAGLMALGIVVLLCCLSPILEIQPC